jgi:hypothetical protein
MVWRSSCRSVMLGQEVLALIKALPTFRVFPAVLKELGMALLRKKKRPAVLAGSRSTAPRRQEPPNDHQESSGPSSTPTSGLDRAPHPSP